MENIAKKTNHVFGRDPKLGFGGEPSPMTALGVFLSIEKAVEIKTIILFACPHAHTG